MSSVGIILGSPSQVLVAARPNLSTRAATITTSPKRRFRTALETPVRPRGAITLSRRLELRRERQKQLAAEHIVGAVSVCGTAGDETGVDHRRILVENVVG